MCLSLLADTLTIIKIFAMKRLQTVFPIQASLRGRTVSRSSTNRLSGGTAGTDAVGTIPSTDELSRVDYCGNMVYDRGERRLLLENGFVTFDLQTGLPDSPYATSMTNLFYFGYNDKDYKTAVNNFFSGSLGGDIYKEKLGYKIGTIKENLRWGDPQATDEDIARVCRLAQADEFIEKMPDKYDTYIEQGGTNVSGGQRQRLCIARALLKKPKILILDDSTSAVDTKTDKLIRKAFLEEIPDTTKIIIAQRISSIEDADKIIVMDKGCICDFGTHEELIRNNEIYREVYNSQKKGSEENA